MRRLPKDVPRLNDHFCSSKFQSHKLTILFRFLQEVGYEDIFNPEEVNEIKDLYEKAQTDLTESIKQVNSLNTQKLEEKLLADESFKRLM
jgi:hypothetical protein